ncbi:MAG: 4-(cytidine 5'-diphospho)-2-C-methyl-D-erythritol kinase, partial [Verrucomicrobiota bacterium]
DIPFFVYRKTCDCSGRGEIVRPTADSGKEVGLPIVLLKPDFGISAASAYQGLSGVKDIDVSETLPQICPWGTMVNDLERPVFYKFPVLQLMKRWLLSQSGVHAAMLSGSGSTMLAVLKNGEGSQKLIKRARKEFGATWWAWSGLTES